MRMKFVGIEGAPQEIRDAIGKCEVCGEQATSLVRDVFEIMPFGGQLPMRVEPGDLRRYCEKHERLPRIFQLQARNPSDCDY